MSFTVIVVYTLQDTLSVIQYLLRYTNKISVLRFGWLMLTDLTKKSEFYFDAWGKHKQTPPYPKVSILFAVSLPSHPQCQATTDLLSVSVSFWTLHIEDLWNVWSLLLASFTQQMVLRVIYVVAGINFYYEISVYSYRYLKKYPCCLVSLILNANFVKIETIASLHNSRITFMKSWNTCLCTHLLIYLISLSLCVHICIYGYISQYLCFLLFPISMIF